MARRKKDNPRQVHEEIVGAWLQGMSKSAGGRRYRTDGTSLWVWGNLVAKKEPEGFFITDAGYQTLLTKNVLNEVLNQLGAGHISQKDFAWFLSTQQGDTKWGGSALITKSGKVIASSTNPRRKTWATHYAWRSPRRRSAKRRRSPVVVGAKRPSKSVVRRLFGYNATKHELVAQVERQIGYPTERLWSASKRTLETLAARCGNLAYKNRKPRRSRMNLHTESERRKVHDIVLRWFRKGMQAAAAHNRAQTAQAFGILQGIKFVADAETSRSAISISDMAHSAMGQIERRWKGIRA